jgi:hypothetical protein
MFSCAKNCDTSYEVIDKRLRSIRNQAWNALRYGRGNIPKFLKTLDATYFSQDVIDFTNLLNEEERNAYWPQDLLGPGLMNYVKYKSREQNILNPSYVEGKVFTEDLNQELRRIEALLMIHYVLGQSIDASDIQVSN